MLKESQFLGEGHKKLVIRLQHRGVRVGKHRVLRTMRGNRLLAPVRQRHERGDRTHSGTIRTQRPDELWGTDATRFWTEEQGWCWSFGAIAHCTHEIVGRHVAKRGTDGQRWSPCVSACADISAASRPSSPWAWDCGTSGGRSIRRISSMPS